MLRPAVMILDMCIAKSGNLSVYNQEAKKDRHSPRVEFNAIEIQYVIETSDIRKNFEAKSFDRGKDRSFGLCQSHPLENCRKLPLTFAVKKTDCKPLKK